MNKQSADILIDLFLNKDPNQRRIAEQTGHSLGIVNRSIAELKKEGFLDEDLSCTQKARSEFEACRPENAVILAAGFGMRMVPINMEIPKAFLEVRGEVLIERLIRQLHEAGIRAITVVVGFMKEEFDYLIDEFGVTLEVNPNYASHNNLHSLALVKDRIKNTYILPCDIWLQENPFRSNELYSWYSVSCRKDPDSDVRVNRKMELVRKNSKEEGNEMIGIAYLTGKEAEKVKHLLQKYSESSRYDDAFWEETLYEKDRMIVEARVFDEEDAIMIDTYEQLREIDSDSNHLRSDAIETAAKALSVPSQEIREITVLKKGMTNRSFLFRCGEKRYIMRIPGEGTDRLINRREEAEVYSIVRDRGICDRVIYINPENGYKITEFMENSRVCDPSDPEDVRKAMKKLKEFHSLGLSVGHRFEIFRLIEFYESLRGKTPSMYRDYAATKQHVLSLEKLLKGFERKEVLTHIDAVPDNFLFYRDENGEERIALIDWEYAGMQDPDVDIAMFAIYALYDREEIDRLIEAYHGSGVSDEIRTKIYCYISACGFLWSNWCEYKKTLGVEFGEYSLRQYRYAKDYYRLAVSRCKKEDSENE